MAMIILQNLQGRLKSGVILYTRSNLNTTNHNIAVEMFHDSQWCDLKLKVVDNLLNGVVYRSLIFNKDNHDHFRSLMQNVVRIYTTL